MFKKDDKRMQDPWGFLPQGNSNIQKCFECGVDTTGCHHVVPVSKGGTKMIPLCGVCHALVHGGVELSHLIKHGLQKARARGVRLGAPSKYNDEIIKTVKELRQSGLPYKIISKKIGLSVGTIFNILKNH